MKVLPGLFLIGFGLYCGYWRIRVIWSSYDSADLAARLEREAEYQGNYAAATYYRNSAEEPSWLATLFLCGFSGAIIAGGVALMVSGGASSSAATSIESAGSAAGISQQESRGSQDGLKPIVETMGAHGKTFHEPIGQRGLGSGGYGYRETREATGAGGPIGEYPIIVRCDECGLTIHVKEAVGQIVKCFHCGHAWRWQGPGNGKPRKTDPWSRGPVGQAVKWERQTKCPRCGSWIGYNNDECGTRFSCQCGRKVFLPC